MKPKTDLQKMSTIYSAVLAIMVLLLLTVVSQANAQSVYGDKFSKESITRRTGGEVIYKQNFEPSTKVSLLLEAMLTDKSASKLQVTNIKLITGAASYIEVIDSRSAFFLTKESPYYSADFSYYSTLISGVEITAESWGDYQGILGEVTAEIAQTQPVVTEPEVIVEPYVPPVAPGLPTEPTQPVVVTQPSLSCQSQYYQAKDDLYACNDEASLLEGQVLQVEKKVNRLKIALNAMNAPLNACLSDLDYAQGDLQKAKSKLERLRSKKESIKSRVYSKKKVLSKLNKVKGQSNFQCDLVDRHNARIIGESGSTRVEALFNAIKKCGINQCGKKRLHKTKFYCNFEFSYDDVASYSDIMQDIDAEKRRNDRISDTSEKIEKPRMAYKKKR